MKTFNLLYLFLVLTFFSCKKQNTSPSLSTDDTSNVTLADGTTCTEHFYFYENKKKVLGTVSTSAVIIGFVPGLEAAEKEKFLASHSTYIKGKDAYQTLDYTSPEIIELQPDLSCAQVEELLGLLKQSSLVRYANPTFIVSEGFRGIGGHFIVTLTEKANYQQLESLTKRTKTRIVEEISPDLKIYLLEADKDSDGNALEMANYFHKHEYIAHAEPDFVLQPSPIGTW
ncbi:hypothetical protein [Botryobacter ruber]|uniref:hypothetical protein n=1 Tax=Botryobacter ruber TaxID=2171629 RepID=UPI000FEC89CB|nr:hypothetical protein [Botryobacter ruber]